MCFQQHLFIVIILCSLISLNIEGITQPLTVTGSVISAEVITDMELVVRKTDLLRELQLFQGIVERKNTIPILANVLIEADGDEVQDARDRSRGRAAQPCQASVTKSGIADAAGEEALRDHQGAAGNRRADRRGQERRQGRGRPVRLAHADAAARGLSDAARTATGAYSATLPRDVLKQMVAKTQFAITGEDTRYFLNGALFILRPDSMSLVVDRRPPPGAHHRAARQDARGKAKADEEVASFCRARRCWSSAGCSSEGDGDIQYERGENHLFFDVGGRLLISRMIDGQFPAFERVIPKGNDKRIEFDRDRLTSAVKRVALLSNERSRAVKFQIDKGKVEIASSSPEFGEAQGSADGRLRRRAGHDLLQRAVRPRFPRRRRDRLGRRSSSRTR